MSTHYRLVQWNRHKRVYDAILAGAIGLMLLAFFAGAALLAPRGTSPEVLLIRALGACAILLLHVILCIGPLARLDRRWAPLLYNRRHLGVTMFVLALGHALLAIGYYGGFGVANPVLAVVGGSSGSSEPAFELMGLIALVILFAMAATSHDFWLKNLTPRIWKWLHMLVYAAYLLLLGHVAFGVMQSDPPIPLAAGLIVGASVVSGLHIAAGRRERNAALHAERGGTQDRESTQGWIDAGLIDEIPESRAKVVRPPGGERIAIFKHEGALTALSNVCVHQGGPLGEGKIVGGCATCPWHGYQYLPHNGCSPPPFTEKLPTYELRLEGRRVLVNPTANPPGTPVTPLRAEAGPPDTREFYVGYLPMPSSQARLVRRLVPGLLAGLVLAAFGLGGAAREPGPGRWAGEVSVHEGVIAREPWPMLIDEHGPMLLVSQSKRGAAIPPGVSRASARGRLIERGGVRMLELIPGGLSQAVPVPSSSIQSRRVGAVRARGEIVDPKCYLGAMKPGDGVPHRACARLCIAGGIPPMLAWRDGAGAHAAVLCTDPTQAPSRDWVDRLVPLVGHSVEVEGELWRIGGLELVVWRDARVVGGPLSDAWVGFCGSAPVR